MDYPIVSPEVAVGYMGPHLEALKNAGLDIKTVLDIGAAHGHFSTFLKYYWPDIDVTAVECNERDRFYLDSTNWNVIYACLGDKKCTKDFFINPSEPTGGGSSFYREATDHFNQPEIEKKDIVTLDSLKLGGFDLVKIDTQGSELDVIKGGIETLKNSRLLLLELSFLPFNKQAPLIDDVLEVTRSLGFRMIETFGPLYGGHWFDFRKIQADVLFAKDGDPLLTWYN